MIIDMEDGWSFNTEFFLGARPHPDKKGMTRVIMTRDEASFITSTKSWEMLTEIKGYCEYALGQISRYTPGYPAS
jgi:hypothetical protein